MRIRSLHIHPVKSLLPVSLPSTSLSATGFPHDRTFLLQRLDTSPPKVLQIGHHAPLCLFAVTISSDNTTLTVTHRPSAESTSFPLSPAGSALGDQVEITLYQSSTAARLVGIEQDEFFTAKLGFPTRLVYLGFGKRKVLGNVAPTAESSGVVGSLLRWTGLGAAKEEERFITFADVASLMITSTVSMDTLSTKLPEGAVTMDRFRPNIVVEPEEGEDVEAFEEDFWGELKVAGDEASEVVIALTANCARCQSLNVDFETGAHVHKDRQILKVLSKDRRVDPGMKYSSVFGRYGFLVGGQEAQLKIGDRVTVSKRLEERTVFQWPGLGTST
ncbi:hypothetical protein EX30DRAFT_158573 [Ascodesmis nigricans]|uniref:MOSC domain-containing protein n=1 Tax=Ascodesmis nigricans TaxID=341454 RepID=A0A4S2MND4_9PEZI|nr:hypothetical protein EX30DRAFT_158573 [Ascodesmis nigricans]